MDKNSTPKKPKKLNEKVLTALLSAGVALLLWLYVVTVISPNSDITVKNVPVTLQGLGALQERDLMITTDELPTVELQLEGNRTDLNKLNSSNISISADVSGILTPGTHELRLGNPSFPSDVPNTAITVRDKKPGKITIEVENKVTEEIPVYIHYTEDTFDSENYMADKENVQLDKPAIKVTGPESVVNKVKMARIEVDLNGQVESIVEQSYAYTLCDEKGEPVDVEKIQTDAEAVLLTLKIVRVKDVPLVFKEVIYGGGATEHNTTITIDPLVIRVSGSNAMLEELEKIELDAIDLSQITENTEFMLPIELAEGITNETGLTEAKIKIEFTGLATQTLMVNNITLTNVPADMTITTVTQQLEITLRGPEAVMAGLLPEQVTVTVDCANVQTGNATLKATITVSVEGVGAVGVYNVTVTAAKKQ